MAREIDSGAVRWRNAVGQVMTSLTGGALAVSIVMIVGLFLLITVRGLAHFWPADLVEYRLEDGRQMLGEVHQREVAEADGAGSLRIKTGNRDLTGMDFVWVDEAAIQYSICADSAQQEVIAGNIQFREQLTPDEARVTVLANTLPTKFVCTTATLSLGTSWAWKRPVVRRDPVV